MVYKLTNVYIKIAKITCIQCIIFHKVKKKPVITNIKIPFEMRKGNLCEKNALTKNQSLRSLGPR
jgi:hypothetical protein